MKRIFFYLNCMALSFYGITFFAMHNIVRREGGRDVGSTVSSYMTHLPRPFHMVKPAEPQRAPELRTHVTQENINAALRPQQRGSTSREPLWHTPTAVHYPSVSPISKAAVWRRSLPSDQQERIEKIYEKMDHRGQEMFDNMSDEQQIDFMKSQLRSSQSSLGVSSGMFKPVAQSSSGKGMLSAGRGMQPNLLVKGIHGPLVPKTLVMPKTVEVPVEPVHSSDVTGDPFKISDLKVLSRKEKDLLKDVDLSKLKDFQHHEELIGFNKIKPTDIQSFEIEKRLADFKDVLRGQGMPSQIVDVTLDGIKNYLVKSKDSGISELVAVKNVQEFLDFESDFADEDYHESFDMAAREQKLHDVIVPVQQAFIDNFSQIVRSELEEINLQASVSDRLISPNQIEQLQGTKTFQEFMQKYDTMKRVVINNFMLRKTSHFIDTLSLDVAEKNLLHDALRTKLDELSGNHAEISEVWQRISNYSQALESYFVIDPVGHQVDHRIDMNSDLIKLVNQWRITMFEAKVKEKLTQLSAPQKVIDTYLKNIRTELADEGITPTQSPTIVFDHIRTLWTDLLEVRSEDVAREVARMEAEEARLMREAQEKLRQEAAKKSQAAEPFNVISKPNEIVPMRTARRVSPSSDSVAVPPKIARSTIEKREPVSAPTKEPSVEPVRKELVPVKPRSELSSMPETVAPQRILREGRFDVVKHDQIDVMPKETPSSPVISTLPLAESIASVSKPDEIVPKRTARRESPSSDTVVVPPSIVRSTVEKKEPGVVPTVEPSVEPVRKELVPVKPRSELSRIPETVAPQRVFREDRSYGLKGDEQGLMPQEISENEAKKTVEQIMKSRVDMEQLESLARAEMIGAQRSAQKKLQLQMQKMIEGVYTGQQQEFLAHESLLRDQLNSLQEQEAQRIQDLMRKDAITMREAGLMLKQQEDILTKMMKEMFAKQLEVFESGKARLLTEAQEQRAREALQKLQQEVQEKFELEMKEIQELQEAHRSDIVKDHAATLESIHALMAQEAEDALERQKAREQKEEDDRRLREEQEADRRRDEHAKSQEKISQEEQEARESAQKAYYSAVHGFNRLHSAVLILLQQLDLERIKITQAEVQSRAILLQAQSALLLAAKYQAQTQVEQDKYVQKMQNLLDQESQKILDDIGKQKDKVVREIAERSIDISRDDISGVSFTSPSKRSLAKSGKDKKRFKELIMKAGKIQQAQAVQKQKDQRSAQLLKKQQEEKFLNDFDRDVRDLAKKIKDALHRLAKKIKDALHPHHQENDDYKEHGKSKKGKKEAKNHAKESSSVIDHKHDHIMPKDPKHQHRPHASHSGDDHDAQDNSDHSKIHPHVPGHTSDHKKPKAKHDQKMDPKIITSQPDDEQVEDELARVGMNVAQDMYDAGEEQVTIKTIQPWIKNNPEYEKLQEDEQKLTPPRDIDNIAYFAGYTQGCMEILQSSDKVLDPQKEEIRDEGARIAQELRDKKIDRVMIPELKKTLQGSGEFDVVDTKNPYAMKWSQGYVQGCMEISKKK